LKVSDLTPPQQAGLLRDFQDYPTFCRESLRLRDRAGSRKPLECWPSQLKLNAAIQKQRKQGKPVRIRALKTRRSGFTVGATSQIFHETPFFPGRRALIVADHYDPAALEAFDYVKQFQEGYTPFARHGVSIGLPELVSDAGEAMGWANHSEVAVYSADRAEIRGGGFHWALFDEVAFWRAARLTLRSARSMVPELPETGIIEQSTANGEGDEWWELCKKAMDPATAEGWLFVFFGWLEDPNNRMRFEHVADEAQLRKTMDREEHALLEMHNATVEQLHWRRWKIRTTFDGHVDDFHQEYPTTPDQAFLRSGRPALTISSLIRMPAWKEPAVGELEEVDEYPQKRLRFVLREPGGALTIGKLPGPARSYVIGADPSKGVDVSGDKRGSDPDWSVAPVLDQATGEQVAQLRGRIRPVPFAEAVCMLGRFYNWAFLVPEANDAGFIDALLRWSYGSGATHYPLERIYARRRDPTDRRSAQPEDIGFETTAATRPWLISALDDAMRELTIVIRSPIAQSECRTFVTKPTGKVEHQVGCHDDCVLALALAVIGLRTAPRVKRVQPATPVRVMVPYGARRAKDDDD
jgi:hypothetical protein